MIGDNPIRALYVAIAAAALVVVGLAPISLLAQSTPVESTCTDCPVAIPDGVGSTVTATMPVTGCPAVAEARVGVAISHTHVGDLVVQLVTPDGSERVHLWSNVGGGSPGAAVLIRDDVTETLSNDSCPDDDEPCAGHYRPELYDADPPARKRGATARRMSALVGQSGDGDWSLVAIDTSSGDAGSIVSSTLLLECTEVTTATATITPTATLAPTASPAPSATPTASGTPSPTPTLTPTASPTPTHTASPFTPPPSRTFTLTQAALATEKLDTATALAATALALTPSPTPTGTPSQTPTLVPTDEPTPTPDRKATAQSGTATARYTPPTPTGTPTPEPEAIWLPVTVRHW